MFKVKCSFWFFAFSASLVVPCSAGRPATFDNHQVTCEYDVSTAIKLVGLGRVWFIPNNFVVRRYEDRVELESESFVRTAYPIDLPDVTFEERVGVVISRAVFGSTDLLANGNILNEQARESLETNERAIGDLTVSSHSEKVSPVVELQYTLVQSDQEFLLLIETDKSSRGDTLPWCNIGVDL